jgi:hypothetical protein
VTLHPRIPKDLALAPVAAAIDINLDHLRDKTPTEIERELELALNRGAPGTPEERATNVRDAALRNVELHGWEVSVTEDFCRLRVSGGSVKLDLGLSESILRYIRDGETP